MPDQDEPMGEGIADTVTREKRPRRWFVYCRVAPVAVGIASALGLGAWLPAASVEDTYDHSEYLATMAEFYGITDPPTIPVEAWVLPEEMDETFTACLQKRGVEFLEDGVTWIIPADGRKAFDLERYICAAQFPPDPEYSKPWTAAQIAVQYDWTVNHVVPCLNERGHTITGIPSRQEFMSTFDSAPFYPFSQIHPMENAASETLEQACPQIAPSKLLFPR